MRRIRGGSDDLSNLQALCYSCNAMKRDRDNTDFRERFYDHRENGCLFCEIPKERIVAENELAFMVRDGFPILPMHSLVIPKRHALTYFDLRPAEINLCHALNSGDAAGQSIFHCHIHLIPRRRGDVDNPRGGVRHIIPGKGDY